jgi:hypothetical protein
VSTKQSTRTTTKSAGKAAANKTKPTEAKSTKGAKPRTRKRKPVTEAPPWAQPIAEVDPLPAGFLPNLNPNQGRTY